MKSLQHETLQIDSFGQYSRWNRRRLLSYRCMARGRCRAFSWLVPKPSFQRRYCAGADRHCREYLHARAHPAGNGQSRNLSYPLKTASLAVFLEASTPNYSDAALTGSPHPSGYLDLLPLLATMSAAATGVDRHRFAPRPVPEMPARGQSQGAYN
jgi:hypothetical protein